MWECPSVTCGHYFKRKDVSNLRVECRRCSAVKGRRVEYCFHCAKRWISMSSMTNCGNPGCETGVAALLSSAPKKKIAYCNVMCPSRRLCPNCGVIIEHADRCKHIRCTKCDTKFCFICLSVKKGEKWSCESYDNACTVAPIQMSTIVKPLQTTDSVVEAPRSYSWLSSLKFW